MTNPNNAIGTNGAFGGRTSVNAFNDVLGTFAGRGILSGWACNPSSGLTVTVGGVNGTRDVAIAEDNAGNKTTINNISTSPISVTIASAPSAGTRIDAIVAYVENPPKGDGKTTDNPGACGIIAVSGTVSSSSPSTPTDSAIRSAITSDGATGTTAYYVILALVTMSSGTTDITSTEISAGPIAILGSKSVIANNINFESFGNQFVQPTASISVNAGDSDIQVVSTTIRESGRYLIQYEMDADATNVLDHAYIIMSVNVNNADIYRSISDAGKGDRARACGFVPYNLSSGDVVKITATSSGANWVIAHGRTALSAVRIG